MKTMQEKFLNTIEEDARNHGLEAVQVHGSSNTGTVYIHMPGLFENVAEIAYNFQPETMSFCMSHRGRSVASDGQACSPGSYSGWLMRYGASEDIKKFLIRYRRVLMDEQLCESTSGEPAGDIREIAAALHKSYIAVQGVEPSNAISSIFAMLSREIVKYGRTAERSLLLLNLLGKATTQASQKMRIAGNRR